MLSTDKGRDYLHDFAADGRFQRTIVVGQARQLGLLGLTTSAGTMALSGTAIVVAKPRATIPWKPLEE
jgi:hypothetical protein